MRKAEASFVLLVCLCLIETSVSFSVTKATTTTTTMHQQQERHEHSNSYFRMRSAVCHGNDGLLGLKNSNGDSNENGLQPGNNIDDDAEEESQASRKASIRKRVATLARNMVLRPISRAYNMPRDIAEVLKEATVSAVDIAMDEVLKGGGVPRRKNGKEMVDIDSIMEDAFGPLEQSLQDMEVSLKQARKSFTLAKSHARDAMEVIQAASIAQSEAAVKAVARAEEVAGRTALADFYVSTTAAANTEQQQQQKQQMAPGTTITATDNAPILTLEDIEFDTTEMAPPFLNDDQCLVPGEPVVRVEKAPENSRRIFAGIDIVASVDIVWKLLTDYPNLAKVVPNLLVNDVLTLYPGVSSGAKIDMIPTEADQCKAISKQMKGAKLRQVGGAKVAGINFSARTTLEVREWPQGMPDFAHFYDEMWQGKSRGERANDYTTVKLERYRFPRPFAISKLPTRDISMQSIEGDDGEFRMYQGVWRMQPLPGCGPPGKEAMRLTYAVEVSPRAYLPVALIEGRIVKDLCTNLNSIRDYAEKVASAAP